MKVIRAVGMNGQTDPEVQLLGVAPLHRHRLAHQPLCKQPLRDPQAEQIRLLAQEFDRDGFHCLVIGCADQADVREIVPHLTSCDVISTPQDVREYPSRRLGIVLPTSTSWQLFRELWGLMQMYNPLATFRLTDPERTRNPNS